jgi:hypothetical protein
MVAAKNSRTTMAKLNRERKLRERRVEKQARKDARKLDAAHEAERAAATDREERPRPEA